MQIIRANYFFTAAFTLEVLLQSIAHNFAFGPNGKLLHAHCMIAPVCVQEVRTAAYLRLLLTQSICRLVLHVMLAWNQATLTVCSAACSMSNTCTAHLTRWTSWRA